MTIERFIEVHRVDGVHRHDVLTQIRQVIFLQELKYLFIVLRTDGLPIDVGI